MKKTFKISGMHCNSCAQLIEMKLKDKVNSIFVNYSGEKAEIDFDENKISEKEIGRIITDAGYECCYENKNTADEKKGEYLDLTKDGKKEGSIEEKEESEEKTEEVKIVKDKPKKKIIERKNDGEKPASNAMGWVVAIASVLGLIILILYVSGFSFKIPEMSIPNAGDNVGLILLFAAGLLTGFHCIAMCGGFVVSYTGKNAIKGHKGYGQHLVYGGSKVISYTIIGGIFGLVGGVFAFSVGLRSWIAILAGIFMIFYALSMFGLKFFRKFQFNPKFLTRFATKEGGKFSGVYSRPLVTGLLNGLFIACGPLQAMYLYAAGTGSMFGGASSLFAFGLGTLPVMLGFGSLASVISHKTTGKILKISAVIVLILGLIMLNRGLTLVGSDYSYDGIKAKISGVNAASLDGTSSVITNGIQEVNMRVSGGYSPNSFVIKKGVPVKWNVNVKQLTGCNQELVMNEYGIDAKLKPGLQTIEFTPTKTGTISFSCGMGMLRGSFIVTETGTASPQEVKAATPSAGMQCGGSGSGGCGGGCMG